MKLIILFIGLVAAAPALDRRQILGNKQGLCQHDHAGLFKDQCKAGAPSGGKGAKAGAGGGFGAFLGKGAQ